MKRISDWLYLITNVVLLFGYVRYLIHFDPAAYEPPAVAAYLLLVFGTYGTAAMLVWFLWDVYHEE